MADAPALAELVEEALEELTRRWRAFTDSSDRARAELLIGDAYRQVLRDYPTVPARMLVDASFADDVRMVVCNATKRTMVAEGRLGVTQENEARGPFIKGRTYSNPDAELEFTAREQELLAGPTAADAAKPRWTGDTVAVPTVVMPHWPRDPWSERRPW